MDIAEMWRRFSIVILHLLSASGAPPQYITPCATGVGIGWLIERSRVNRLQGDRTLATSRTSIPSDALLSSLQRDAPFNNQRVARLVSLLRSHISLSPTQIYKDLVARPPPCACCGQSKNSTVRCSLARLLKERKWKIRQATHSAPTKGLGRISNNSGGRACCNQQRDNPKRLVPFIEKTQRSLSDYSCCCCCFDFDRKTSIVDHCRGRKDADANGRNKLIYCTLRLLYSSFHGHPSPPVYAPYTSPPLR